MPAVYAYGNTAAYTYDAADVVIARYRADIYKIKYRCISVFGIRFARTAVDSRSAHDASHA